MPELAKHAPLAKLLVLTRRYAMDLNEREVREQNFILTLLMRHCQSRIGIDKLEPFAGKPPDDPNKCLDDFKLMALELEGFSATDNTFIVNLLQQAFQWRAANEVEQLMMLSKASVQ